MDIISLGKASKVLRDIEKLDKQVVAEKAENRFTTVDGRLDYIESQISNIQGEAQYQVDLSKGTYEQTEFKEEAIQLQQISEGKYKPTGIWESSIIDLGNGWQNTISVEVK